MKKLMIRVFFKDIERRKSWLSFKEKSSDCFV